MKENVNRPVSQYCIMMIGSLNDQRFILSLERMIDEYKDHEDYPQIKEACIYALAKLGVENYINEVLSNDGDIKWGYLGTKEAFIKWLEISLRWDKWSRIYSEGGVLPLAVTSFNKIGSIISYNTIPKNLIISVKNVEEFDNSVIGKDYDPFKDKKNKKTIEKIYKLFDWIKENQDKWELPPANDSY